MKPTNHKKRPEGKIALTAPATRSIMEASASGFLKMDGAL